jgi:hypothetical protein
MGEKATVTIETDEEHKKGKITVKASIALWTSKNTGLTQKELQKAAQEYKANIEKAWSGTYEQDGIKYEVTTTVDIQVYGSEQDATNAGAQNVLRVTEEGGHSGINPASLFGGPDTGEIAFDAGTRNSEAAHEFTHMLGVGEHYGANVSNTTGALRAMSATAYDYGWAFGGAINEHREGSRQAISPPCCPYPGVRLPAILGQRQSRTSARELGAPIKTGTGFDWWR